MIPKIVRISCSLIAALDKGLDLIQAVESMDKIGIDMIHYDVTEHENSLKHEEIENYRKYTSLPFDIHLTLSDPRIYIDKIDLSDKDYLSLHVENNLSKEELQSIKSRIRCHLGLAIKIETPIDALYDFMDFSDFVLFMSAAPGVSGGSFNDIVVDKVKRFKKLFPKMPVHVDGGVNNLSAALLRDLDIDVIVSGSYILGTKDNSAQVVKLLGRDLYQDVSQIMRRDSEIPKVKIDDKIEDIADEITKKKVGSTCVVDDNNILLGIITDGDLRRKLITNSDLSHLTARDIMNKKPLTTNPEIRLLNLLREVHEKNKVLNVIPVIDGSHHCVGILWLTDIVLNNNL